MSTFESTKQQISFVAERGNFPTLILHSVDVVAPCLGSHFVFFLEKKLHHCLMERFGELNFHMFHQQLIVKHVQDGEKERVCVSKFPPLVLPGNVAWRCTANQPMTPNLAPFILLNPAHPAGRSKGLSGT